MRKCRNRIALLAAACLSFAFSLQPSSAEPKKQSSKLRAVLVSAEQAAPRQIASARSQGAKAIVLELKGVSRLQAEREAAAIRAIQDSGLDLHYWIEIGRDAALADAHPEWMASLQGHQEWRRFFKDFPKPAGGEVVKNYPWTPILNRETFDAHLERVERLLQDKPPAKGVFLNDLQGAPSACGCGNPLCRWTGDYGPIRTATAIGDDAAAQFVTAVGKLAPQSQIVPVWVTECEQHDGAADGLCAGVGCFEGACWRAYTKQLAPLADRSDNLAVLLTYREFQPDLTRFDRDAGWIKTALGTFQTMPPRHGGEAIAEGRLIAVLQGHDLDDDEIEAQKQIAADSGAGYIISRIKIDQSWQPRIVKYKE